MPIKVLLADDSQIMLTAIRKVLGRDPRLQIVGEVSNFTDVLKLILEVQPDVLLMDLHLPERISLPSDFVKTKLASVPCTLAVSLSNDNEAKALAESYGAASLLNKMNLYNEMIPAIIGC